jgi:hypothetical protein
MAKSRKQIEEEARIVLQMLEKQVNLQNSVNSSYDKYIEAVKKYKDIQATLTKSIELERITRKKILDHQSGVNVLSAQQLIEEQTKLKILEKQNFQLSLQRKLYKDTLKEVNAMKLALADSVLPTLKALEKIPGLFKGAYSNLKGLGLFEMDKAMKQSALSMGILSKESGGFRGSIISASKQTAILGIGIKELSQIQAQYSEGVGTTALMSERTLKALGEMAAATGLGAEGTAQMAVDMRNQNVSAENTAKFVEQTMNSSHKLGVDASKVVKLVSKNIKMLNKYNFKDGVKGLAKMAQTITKLGVDMEFAAGFADKLWDVEGAVNMSAQLQVMGGAWAQLADPFHLMYMARNDMAGLTEEIGKAAEQSVVFNKKTGQFDMPAKEMHRLKIIAEQTGIAYDDLVTAGKNAKKFSMINAQVNFDFGGDKDLKEYVTNKSFLDEKGDAKIVLNGETKLLKTLSQQDKNILKTQMQEQASLKARAQEAQSFDETLSNLIMQLKIYLLPLITKLSDPKKGLVAKLQDFSEKINKKGGLGETISKLAGIVGDFVAGVANFMVENPMLVAGIAAFTKSIPLLIGGIKLFGGLFNAVKWFMNGLALSKGFMVGTGGMGGAGGGGMRGAMNSIGGGTGQIGGGLFGMRNAGAMSRMGLGTMGKIGANFRGAAGSAGAIGGGLLAGGIAGFGEYGEQKEKGKGTGEAVGRGVLKGLGAGGGAWAGAAAGAALGSVIPVVGTIIGGLLGGAIGGMAGGKLGDLDTYGVDDAIFTNPINDGFKATGPGEMLSKAMGKKFGSNHSKGNGIMTNGTVTPIHNADKVKAIMASKPGGGIDRYERDMFKNSSNSEQKGVNNSTKHSFEPINGSITVEIPGLNKSFSVEDKDAMFESLKEQLKRKVTEDVTNTRVKNKNGGKTKPTYS